MSYSPNTPVVSTLNALSATVSGSGSLTGDWELAPRGEVLVMVNSAIAATVFFEFSNDGAGAADSIFPVAGYSASAGVPLVRRAVVGGRYFRLRITYSGASSSAITAHVSFAQMGALNSPIGNTIATDADAQIVKSVISGVGDTNARVTDHSALQVTPPPEGKTAFGEALVGMLEPIIGVTFPYGVNSKQIVSQANQSGTVSTTTSMLQVATGAAANSSGSAYTVKRIKYEPGLGVRARFTAIFTAGVADSTQIIGIGDSGEGYFFGYNGTSFGILRRYGGNPEVRTLTISAGANDGTGTDDVTITLDGDAKTVTLTDFTGTASITANEIAASSGWGNVGRGWDARAVGNRVIFTSWDSSPHSGTYSFADTDATGAAGTFSSTLTGVSPTDVWVAQSSWNGDDKFDGTGVTGVTLDPTKGNVYQIDFQYLGFGAIRFYVEDPDDGELHLVHAIAYANANTRPALDNPSMPMFISAENTSNTSDLVLKTGSMAAFLDGKRRNTGLSVGVKADATISTANETPVITLRVKQIFNGAINRSKIKINFVGASCEHTKPVFINFYAGATLVGASFTDVDGGVSPNVSTLEKDTSATAFSGGQFLFAIPLGKTGNLVVDLKDDLDIGEFQAGDTLTVTAAPRSGTNAEVSVSFNFTEKL